MQLKFLKYFLLFVLILSIAGCAKVSDHIVFNDDGNASREIDILIDKTDPSYSNKKVKVAIQKAEGIFKSKGYHVQKSDTVKQTTIKLYKVINGVDKENLNVLLNEGKNGNKGSEMLKIIRHPNFFFTTYTGNSDLFLNYLNDQFGSKNIDYRLYLSFTDKVHGVHNAQAVLGNGKVLAWKLPVEKTETVSLDIYTVNYSHITMVAAPIIGILLLAVYLMITNKEKEIVNRRIPKNERSR